MIDHLDEDDKPCARHVAVEPKLLAYALVGSRISGFHHDAASKLQSLVMALDEMSELIGEADSDLRAATDTAQGAVRQLHGLLTANRALAKTPAVTRTALPELLSRAGDRHGVKVRGNVPTLYVMVAPPSITHAFALLLDMIAGPPVSGRQVTVSSEVVGDRVRVMLEGNVEATHQNANELIAIAAFAIKREEGTLHCGPKRFVVELARAE